MHEFDALDGAILIDKPAGPTSHDVVDAIRDEFKLKKVGHCGTLDPNATGLLVVVLGRGTKLSEKLMSSDKVYEGTVKFGETTDSYDADGELTASLPVPPVTLEELNRLAAEFAGTRCRCRRWSRPSRRMACRSTNWREKGSRWSGKRGWYIYNFKFSDYYEPIGHFRVACTKGTYVRSLAHELGQKVGCGAHLANLRRVVSGKFNVADAIEFEQVLGLPLSELEKRVIPFVKLLAE